MGPFLLGVALVIYNGLVNLWPLFHGGAYVPLNLAAAGLVAIVGGFAFDLSAAGMGFTSGWGTDLVVGAGLGLALAAPVLGMAWLPRMRRFVADERMRGVTGAALAYKTLIRVPLGTALLEELAFRGVLYGAWLGEGVVFATVASAAAFGLWHVTPARDMIRLNRPSASRAAVLTWIGGTIVVTGLAGAGFALLRDATNGIAAPFALHATLNSMTSLGAAKALRRS
ncbi:MAG: CPBP family intramembrane glutamic endopeptidase [Actinomycetota bacterium]